MPREVFRVFAPITQGARDVHGLLPSWGKGELSQSVADIIAAEDELSRQKRDKFKPLWQRALLNMAIGGTVGGLVAGAKSIPFTRNTINPKTMGTIAGLSAATALAFTLGRHALRKKLRSEATGTLREASEAAKYVARHPLTREKSKSWETAQWAPWGGMEAGAILGAIGALAGGWAKGTPNTPGAQAALAGIGAGLGGVAGLGLGYLYRKRKQREFLTHVENELSHMPSSKAQEAVIESAVEQDPILKAASTIDLRDVVKTAYDGVNRPPVVSTNAPLLRGMGGPPNRWSISPHGARRVFANVFADLGKVKTGADDAGETYNDDVSATVATTVTRIYEEQNQEKPAEDSASQQKTAKEKEEDHTIEVVVNHSYHKALANLLATLKSMSSMGCSRDFTIPDFGSHGIDGDGSDRIKSLKMDGKDVKLEKGAADKEREPVVDDHASAPQDKMRPRAELILWNKEGVFAIDKGDYVLFPGGGVDDGEQPRDAAIRETLEEANRHAINVANSEVVESVWPTNSGNEFWDTSEFDGERTYFFSGVDAGEAGVTHADQESFAVIDFDTLISKLQELVKREDQAWASRNNEVRLKLVKHARRLAASKVNLEPIKQASDGQEKTADIAQFLPRKEVFVFTPSGKLAIRRSQNRRFELPSDVEGKPVPYELPVQLIPEGGVPEPGMHGYNIALHSADSELPEGFEEADPQDVLKDLYAALGKPENRPYQSLDRARARSLLRLLKKRVPSAVPQG